MIFREKSFTEEKKLGFEFIMNVHCVYHQPQPQRRNHDHSNEFNSGEVQSNVSQMSVAVVILLQLERIIIIIWKFHRCLEVRLFS